MFKTFINAFKIKEIRRKLFYMLLMLVIIRIGSQIPVPGTDSTQLKAFFALQTNGAFNFLDAFTGGSLSSFSILALSVSPYITSSIIVQLLTIAIPALEEMHKDGEDGKKKLNNITRYLTIGLALFESVAMSIGFGNQGLIPEMNFWKIVVVTLCLTAGSAFLMWLGEQITEKGIGSGISFILLVNIVSRIPADFANLYAQFIKGQSLALGGLAAIIIAVVVIGLIILVLILNGAERRIPVQYSKKMQGRKQVGGQSTHIPMKVNTAGVIPVIFASSIMSFPGIIAQFAGASGTGEGFGNWMLNMLNSNRWFDFSNISYTIGLVLYIALVIFFAYFYTSISFNPIEIADNMKKNGGFVPGIRPGKPTTEYLTNILNRIIFIGAIGLCIVVILPFFFNGVFGANVSFAGTSIIIVVGVILETVKQIESMMIVRNYKGFLND